MTDNNAYAGDLTPAEVWDRLNRDAMAAVVDVRTHAEWVFVGLPDLSAPGRPLVKASWQLYPSMARNPGFLGELAAAGITPEHTLLLLCRSGVRSRAAAQFLTAQGFATCYNIIDGFEGQLDTAKRRGVGGWKAAGLPWVQG